MTDHTDNIANLILRQGEDHQPALLVGTQILTYGELRQRVVRVAAGLQSRGLDKGTLVGILAHNSPFFVATYLGAIMAGLVAVPLSPSFRAEEIRNLVASLGMKHLFASKRQTRLLTDLGPTTDLTIWTDGKVEHPLTAGTLEDLLTTSTGLVAPVTQPNDLAVLMLTSGSTGPPKAVMVTHRNIEANTQDIAAYLELTAADRAMVILPFHYCFGTSVLHSHLFSGGSVILGPGFTYPELILDEMEAKQATNLAGVPSTYQILLHRSSFATRQLPSVRLFQQAGGKLPNASIEEIREAFPRAAFYTMYGQTEATARLSYLPPERLGDKLGSIGRGIPSTTLEVLTQNGTSVAPGTGEIGEIVASGPNITPGYYHDPIETARFFRDGRLWTGDLASVDEDGFIYIVGRKREFIKPMGHRVSPLEVESVINEVSHVVESAVFGVPDPVMGEKIRALIVPAKDCRVTEDNVIRHCRSRLPEYEVPDRVRSVTALPKNSQGKVSRKDLTQVFDVASECP